jgi:hypothetical protein
MADLCGVVPAQVTMMTSQIAINLLLYKWEQIIGLTQYCCKQPQSLITHKPFSFYRDANIDIITFHGTSGGSYKVGKTVWESLLCCTYDQSIAIHMANILLYYDLLTVDDIATYVTPWIGNDTHWAQNNFHMYTCMLSSEQLPYVHMHHGFTYQRWLHQDSCWTKRKYHIGQHPCTMLLYKLLMQKAVIDTHSTSSLLWENLSNLDTYMSTIKRNIK